MYVPELGIFTPRIYNFNGLAGEAPFPQGRSQDFSLGGVLKLGGEDRRGPRAESGGGVLGEGAASPLPTS